MNRKFIALSLAAALFSMVLTPVLASQPIVISVSKFVKEEREAKNFMSIFMKVK